MRGFLLALACAAAAQNGGQGETNRQELLAQLPAGAADNPGQLRQLASTALNQKDPRRALAIADLIAPDDKNYGAAQTLKARALEQLGDKKAALKAWREVMKDPGQRALAVAHVKLLQSDASGTAAAAPGAASAGGTTYNGLTSRDLNLVASMFRSRDASQTLAATLRKAARGDASGLADLRRHGIDFARGPAEQTEAVVLRNDNGTQVISFSPGVLDNPNRNRAIAGMANGVEQAATQRDYTGVSRWLREWGGRLVAVVVYRQLEPGAMSNQNVPSDDQRLVSDAIVYTSAQSHTFLKLPSGESISYFAARDQAARSQVTDSTTIFLYFCGQAANRTAFNPAALQGDDQKYNSLLYSIGK